MIRKFVGECERIPFGYGVAWRDFAWCGSICYPVPINLLMRWLRDLWFLTRLPYECNQKWWEKREIDIFHAQREIARRDLDIRATRLYKERFDRDFEAAFAAEFRRRANAVWRHDHAGNPPF